MMMSKKSTVWDQSDLPSAVAAPRTAAWHVRAIIYSIYALSLEPPLKRDDKISNPGVIALAGGDIRLLANFGTAFFTEFAVSHYFSTTLGTENQGFLRPGGSHGSRDRGFLF
jgi:hypothetical protein